MLHTKLHEILLGTVVRVVVVWSTWWQTSGLYYSHYPTMSKALVRKQNKCVQIWYKPICVDFGTTIFMCSVDPHINTCVRHITTYVDSNTKWYTLSVDSQIQQYLSGVMIDTVRDILLLMWILIQNCIPSALILK